MNSMKIGTYQMDTTFGLYLPEYTIPAPAVQTNFVKIIGRDGSVDLSNALGLHYDSRTWSLDFKCFDPTVNWHTLSSQVMNAIHGKRLNFEFDDDPNYFWTGRVSVQNYVSNHGTGTLKVTIVSDPFKYAKLSTIVTKTASTGTEYTGALVTFNTANAKINDLSVTMQPIQDLHGYDSPWPGGGGINKAKLVYKTLSASAGYRNLQDNSVTVYSSSTTAAYRYGQFALFDAEGYAGQTLTFTAKAQQVTGSSNPRILGRLYDSNGSAVGSAIFEKTGTSITHTFTLPATIDSGVTFRVSLYCNSGSAEATETNFYDIQVEVGSTAHDFAPYENICPISGRTGLNVYRTGKNLGNFIDGYSIDPEGHVVEYTPKPRCATVDPIIIDESKSYVVSSAGAGYHFIYATWNNGTLVRRVANISNGTVLDVSGGTHLYLCLYEDVTVSTGKPMVEIGTVPTSYEPYNGNTYAEDWTSQAGTVYGGTVDVVTGVLTVTYAISTITETVNASANYSRFILGAFGILDDAKQSYCNILTRYTGTASTIGINQYVLYNSSGYGAAQVNIKLVENQSSQTAMRNANNAILAQWAAEGHPLQIVWGLATPITYQLTAQEVDTLVGTNNVWSDGGNVTVAVVTPETLTNNGRAVVPTLTASADMVLKWGNYSASVQQGTSTIPQLILENGANLIYIIGTGSISFTWQEASL